VSIGIIQRGRIIPTYNLKSMQVCVGSKRLLLITRYGYAMKEDLEDSMLHKNIWARQHPPHGPWRRLRGNLFSFSRFKNTPESRFDAIHI